jgi:hypothetical protein
VELESIVGTPLNLDVRHHANIFNGTSSVKREPQWQFTADRRLGRGVDSRVV